MFWLTGNLMLPPTSVASLEIICSIVTIGAYQHMWHMNNKLQTYIIHGSIIFQERDSVLYKNSAA